MSRDIRSFFNTLGTNNKTTIQEKPPAKRKAIKIASDEDEKSPKKAKSPRNQKIKTKKRRVIESDDEKSPVKVVSKKPNLAKLREQNVPKVVKPSEEDLKLMFGDVPKRVERKKAPKKEESNDTVLLLSDDEFDKSFANLDEVSLMESKNIKIDATKKLVKSPEERNGSQHTAIDNIIEKSPSKSNKNEIKQKTPIKIEKTSPEINSKKSPKKPEKSIESPKLSSSPKRKSKKDDLESSILSDEERHERKRMAAMLYQKYKNRSTAPTHPGTKEIPKGTPNCLAGLSFVVTGILESLDRDECCDLIKELGGKISQTVGKRLNYLVVGEEAGPKKLATADELGIRVLNEDNLFDLIKEKSVEKTQKKNNSNKTSPNKIKQELKHDSPESKTSMKKTPEKTRKKEDDSNTSPNKIKQELKHDSPESKISIASKKKTPEKRKIQEENEMEDHRKRKLDSPKKKAEKKASPKKIFLDKEKSIVIDSDILAWVDKYKPTKIKEIIGQQGAASICVKLQNWLSKWYTNQNGKNKLQKPNPWAKNTDGSYFKAALLSGPPGVGKTTTATLVCKELGFDTVEFNASDTRSKKLLKEEVAELLSNKSLYGYFNGKSETVTKKHVLLMDEVDGMAGNEDRGGIQELISLIKDSSVPIICMCNDRNHQKMRSLVNYCYDLRFNKPRMEQIRGPIMSICFREKIKLPAGKIEEIIAATNNDIRQTLNHLSLLSAGIDLNLDPDGKEKTANKNLKFGPWDVVRKVFSVDDHKNMNLNERSDLFFQDYSLGPLFVQQNYLSVAPSVPKSQVPEQVALTADSLSLGDLIDKRIRSSSAWTLLPVQAMFSSVMPGEFMEGHFVSQINFPSWLGKYSKSNKRSRLAQEIHDHTRCRTSGSRLSVRMDYAPFLLDAIVRPLKDKGLDGVEESLNVIKEYRLLREDIDALIELTTWPGRKNPMDSVDSKVKAALTRLYNKEVLAYSYSAMAGVKKKKTGTMDDIDGLEEGEGEAAIVSSDDEDDGKLENDALIKAKKRPASKAGTSSKASAETKKPSAASKKGKTGKSAK